MKNPKFTVTLDSPHGKLLGGLEAKKKRRKSKQRGATTETQMLECLDCNETKHRSEFYKSSNNKSGKQGYCIPCSRERMGLERNGKRYKKTKPAESPVVEAKPVTKKLDTMKDLVEAYRHVHNIHDHITLEPNEVLNAVVTDFVNMANMSRRIGGAE
tara:strand:+ start:1085 stop:1555 length:471 start_codon:yes stop_codon:yes gene_type:complete